MFPASEIFYNDFRKIGFFGSELVDPGLRKTGRQDEPRGCIFAIRGHEGILIKMGDAFLGGIPFPNSLFQKSSSRGFAEDELDKLRGKLDRNDEALRELRNGYGLRIVKYYFGIVWGPQFLHPLTIAERINGSNLEMVEYSDREKPQVTEELNQLYSSLARYLKDKYQLGGPYIRDITWGGAMSSGNTQFVRGTSAGDKQPNIYLVDVGPSVKIPRLIEEVQEDVAKWLTPGLCQMIEQSEAKIGTPLIQARSDSVRLIDLLNPELLSRQGSRFRSLERYKEMFQS